MNSETASELNQHVWVALIKPSESEENMCFSYSRRIPEVLLPSFLSLLVFSGIKELTSVGVPPSCIFLGFCFRLANRKHDTVPLHFLSYHSQLAQDVIEMNLAEFRYDLN